MASLTLRFIYEPDLVSKLDWCKPTREAVYAIPVTEEGASAANTWLRSQIGTQYNYEAILGLAIHVRIGLSKHEVICSALMLEYLWRAHLQPLNVVKGYESLITPEALHLSPLLIGHCTYKL